VYLALDKGKPVPDAAAAAKAAKPGSTAAQTFSKMGPPDQLVVWETDNQKFESWFYWSKNNVFHFQGGELSVRSDWNTADLKPSGGTGGKKYRAWIGAASRRAGPRRSHQGSRGGWARRQANVCSAGPSPSWASGT